MPATITHSYFTMDVYDILPETMKKKIEPSRLRMFGQAFDPLMFYNLFSIFPGKKIRELDDYCHANQTKDFFINTLKTMKEKKLITDKECCSFLTGFICHYVLDSTIHPYVIYKTGIMDKKVPSTYKYNNIHAFMETFIDNDMVLRREKTNPYKFRLDKYCFDTREFSINLDYLIDHVFLKTYNVKDMSWIYYKSLKQMKRALMVFRRDTTGIKRTVYKLVDTFTPSRTFRFEAVSYHYPLEDKHNFLNNEHRMWRNPALYDRTSEESFIDLYVKAIKRAKIMVCASFDYLNGKDIDLDAIFKNNSYLTGLDCEKYKELKYFEF